MSEKLTFDIQVGGNQDQALGSLKAQLKEATQEVQKLSEKFGATSEQAIEAAKRAAELKDQIGDAATLVDAFNPDTKFKAFSQTLGTVAGGFSAVQGALGLLGSKGEDVEKTLAKVQSALALSQGLEQIGDLGAAFTNLKGVAIDTFKGIKGAIGATGIGALVVALGAIVTYWDDIKEAVSGVSDEQKKLLTDTQADAKAQQEKLSTIDSQDNILKLQGKSERDILGIKIKQTEQVIVATEKQVEQQKIVLQAQLAAEKRNKEILKGILTFVTAPLQLVIDGVNQVAKVFGKGFEFNVAEKLSGLVFDPKETEKKGQSEIAALDKTLNDLKNKKAGYQLAVQNIDKQASDTAKANADKAAEEENARLEKQLADEKKLTEDLLSEYDKRRKFAINSKTLTQKELNALDEQEKVKQQEADNKKFDTQIATLGKTKNFTLQNIQQIQKTNQESKEAEAQIDKLAAEQKIALAQQTASALMAVSDVLGKETAAGKALAISAALINTYQGISAGVKLGFPAAIPAVAIAAATGFSAVKNIIATKVPGAGSGGAGNMSSPNLNAAAPIAPPQPQAATTNISSQSINALGNQAIRSYVVESDVTSNQQRIAAIQQRARFG